jgi:hypothetical protein
MQSLMNIMNPDLGSNSSAISGNSGAKNTARRTTPGSSKCNHSFSLELHNNTQRKIESKTDIAILNYLFK